MPGHFKILTLTSKSTDSKIRSVFPVFHYLRPHLTEDAFVTQVSTQFQEGYQIAVIEENAIPCAAAGYHLCHFLAWGYVCYVDDLITAPTYTKRGYASFLLDHIIDLAIAHRCEAIHLDSGHQRFDAHRLYLNKGFEIRSHHFSKSLL